MRDLLYKTIPAALLAATYLLPLQSQETSEPSRTVEFKGTARLNAHVYPLQKGATYRITVQAEGFVPHLAVVDDQGVLTSTDGTLAGAAQLVLTPPETREYKFLVTFATSGKLDKGETRYVLTLEKASFATETTAKEPLRLNEQTRTLTAKKIYNITVKSSDFEPDVRILDGGKTLASRNNYGSGGLSPFDVKPLVGKSPPKLAKAEYVTNISFAPLRTGDYRILVSVGPNSKLADRALEFTTVVTELKPLFSVVEELKNEDPPYKRWGDARHKVHPLRLESGTTYQIDLASDAFDAYLFLENAEGQVVQADDDSGGNLNARIVVRPTTSQTYRVIATTFDRDGFATGRYSLSVVANPYAQAIAPLAFPAPGEPLDKK